MTELGVFIGEENAKDKDELFSAILPPIESSVPRLNDHVLM